MLVAAACAVPLATSPSTPRPPPSDPAPPVCEASVEPTESEQLVDPVEPPAPDPIDPPAKPIAPAKPAFEPTAFSVEVAGHGRPVILIPGLACPGAVWRDTVAHLADAETHVLTLSGFAGRPAIGGPLLATARAELAAYIRDRKLDHPVVIGHSLGALLAYGLAITEPDLVGPIVAVDEPLGWCSADMLPIARMRRDHWSRMTTYELGQAMREFFAPMARDPAMVESIVAEAQHSDPHAVGDATYELCATDLRADAAKLTTPVLAVLADGPYQQMIRAQLAPLPDREVVVVPRTRHFVMFDEPRAFFATLDAFLAAHPPG